MTTVRAQERLATLGYDPGPSDGALGPRTVNALAGVANGTKVPPEVGAALWPWMRRFGITTPERIANFLANIAHESRFKLTQENLSYSAPRLMAVWPSRFPTLAAATPYAYNPPALANKVYGGRMGNTAPGDGWKYRGRGWAQITGRDAYSALGAITGLPLEADPDLVLTYEGSAATAAGFWEWKGLGPLADLGYVETVRRRWNGGALGLAEVKTTVARLVELWR